MGPARFHYATLLTIDNKALSALFHILAIDSNIPLLNINRDYRLDYLWCHADKPYIET